MILDCANKKEFEFYLLDNPLRLKRVLFPLHEYCDHSTYLQTPWKIPLNSNVLVISLSRGVLVLNFVPILVHLYCFSHSIKMVAFTPALLRSEASTYSLRNSASLPSQPMNHTVLHLRGFSQNPAPVIQFTSHSLHLLCIFVCWKY